LAGPASFAVALVIAAAGAGVLGAVATGCDERPVRTFLARRWNPALGCLDRSTVLDVVVTDAGTCPRHCLVQRGEAGTVTYITLECPPYLPGLDPTELDPTCKLAKDAFDRGDTCLPDGGQTNPPPDAAADSAGD
jgi:hypothetical protein